jgi:hypothetical protein
MTCELLISARRDSKTALSCNEECFSLDKQCPAVALLKSVDYREDNKPQKQESLKSESGLETAEAG